MESKRLTILGIIVGIVMGIPSWVAVVLMFWFRWYPDPTMEPEIMRPLMTGWLPVIIITASSILSAVMLLIVAAKGLNNKRLRGEIANLKAGLESEIEKASQARSDAKELQKQAKQADLRANQEINQKNEFYKLHHDSERKLADVAWLVTRASEQGRDISAHVVIKKVKPLALNLTSSPRCIIVAVTIRNESIFDITIRAKNMSGSVFFGNTAREDPARIQETNRSPIENLGPNETAILVIEQPLLKSEAETIGDSLVDENARFWLGNLKIPISVENVSQEVKPQDLRFPEHLEHIYLNDFGALTLDARAFTPEELIHYVDLLPRTERVSVYRAILKAYVDSLIRVHEAEEKKKDNPDDPTEELPTAQTNQGAQ